MVNNCAISTCKKRYSTINSDRFCGVMMHSIPKSIDSRSKWLKAIEQINPGFKHSVHTKICSLHFKDSDYSLSVVSNRRVLRKEAIPSIFANLTISHDCESTSDKEIIYDHTYSRRVPEIPDTETKDTTSSSLYNPEGIKSETILCTCIVDEEKNVQPDKSQSVTPYKPRKRKHYIGDFKFADIESPDERTKFWHASQRSFRMQQSTIKDLQKKNHRLQQKIKNLNQMIDHLQRENKVITSVVSMECGQIHKHIPVRPSIS